MANRSEKERLERNFKTFTYNPGGFIKETKIIEINKEHS